MTGCLGTAVQGVIALTEGVVGGRDGAARLGLPRTTLIAKMRRLRVNFLKVVSARASRRVGGMS
jgi:hypothetical protein